MIRRNVLCELHGGVISLTGADSMTEITLKTDIENDVHQEGRITIPGKKLVDAWRMFPEEALVTVELLGNQVHLCSGSRKFVLSTMPASDYDRMDIQSSDYSVEILAQDVQKLVRQVGFAIAEQDIRQYLNGMLLHVSSRDICSVATDAHRMSIYTCSYIKSSPEIKKDLQVIIPRRSVLAISRFLDQGHEKVTLTFSENCMKVDLGESEGCLVTKLIDGVYPDYKAVIPKGQHSLVCPREPLRDVLECSKVISDEHQLQVIDLNIRENVVLMHAQNSDNEILEEEIAVTYDGEPLKVRFKVDYLQDVVNVLEGEEVKISIKNVESGFLFKDVDDDCGTYLVMPVRA